MTERTPRSVEWGQMAALLVVKTEEGITWSDHSVVYLKLMSHCVSTLLESNLKKEHQAHWASEDLSPSARSVAI